MTSWSLFPFSLNSSWQHCWILIILHLSILKSRRQYILDHSIRQSRSCCNRKPSSTFETFRLIFVSSANINIMLLRIHRGKSFMNIKKQQGTQNRSSVSCFFPFILGELLRYVRFTALYSRPVFCLWCCCTLYTETCYLRQRRRYMFCPCLFVCLLARLLKNACMDLDGMLRVDRCRDMDELINFWARSGS